MPPTTTNSGVPYRVGPPRLDPEKRQLLRFYEPLILLSLLDRTQEAEDTSSSARPQSRGFQQIWRRALDDLCCLCDFNLGGSSVCALVAIKQPSGTLFYMAVTAVASSSHLEWVLQRLEALSDPEGVIINDIAEEIAQRSVKFGRKKVKDYTRLLKNAYHRADGAMLNDLDQQKTALLRQELDNLAADNTSDYSICQKAQSFQSQGILDEVVFHETFRSLNKDWLQVRHLMGRLRQWHRASNRLVKLAKICPQYFHDATVDHMRVQREDVAVEADSKTNLRSAIRRMLPANSEDRINSLVETLERMRDFNVEEQFVDIHTERLQPRVHVEVALLNELYEQGLLPYLVGDERYIGCSKPSCYCCNLYMRCHPANPVCRASHGNVWHQWFPPAALKLGNGKTPTTTGRTMDAVIAHIRRDVIYQIESRQPRRDRRPDSTTGLTVTS